MTFDQLCSGLFYFFLFFKNQTSTRVNPQNVTWIRIYQSFNHARFGHVPMHDEDKPAHRGTRTSN